MKLLYNPKKNKNMNNINTIDYWNDRYIHGNKYNNREINELHLSYMGFVILAAYGNVLEIGCGNGKLAVAIAKRRNGGINKVIGVDLSDVIISKNNEYVSKNNINNIEFRQMDAYDLKFNNEFDTIIAIETVEHLSYIDKFMKQVFNVAKNGAKFVATVPYKHAIKSKEHVHTFSYEKIVQMFRPYYKDVSNLFYRATTWQKEARNIIFSFNIIK